jgi:hypothetical protein
MPRPPLAPLAFIAFLPLAGCDAGLGDTGYKVVAADITYGPGDKRDREWNALMKAMDTCHNSGFTDAQPAVPPKTQCLESGPNGCTRFAAHLTFDCIGMGYQSN